MPKCKYCVEEYRYWKRRKLLDIKNVAIITDGVGYCFEHLDYHKEQSLEKQLQEHLVGRMQREAETQRFSAMLAPEPCGLVSAFGATMGYQSGFPFNLKRR